MLARSLLGTSISRDDATRKGGCRMDWLTKVIAKLDAREARTGASFMLDRLTRVRELLYLEGSSEAYARVGRLVRAAQRARERDRELGGHHVRRRLSARQWMARNARVANGAHWLA